MLVLVTGGAASGKSALAERVCCALGAAPVYIATMRPHGAEARARIARHREQRAGLGFVSVECYTHLAELMLPEGRDAALLECLGNWVANEMFGDDDAGLEEILDRSVRGVDALLKQVENLVLVGNEVGLDGGGYEAETMAYIRCLSRLQAVLAARADVVVESVCGLPLVVRGKELVGRCGL